jgi:uncharacterized protein (DUF433 family)
MAWAGPAAGYNWAEASMTLNYQDRIDRNPRVAGGEAVIKGTRVTLRTVLASLAEGATTDEILKDFPTLTERTFGQRSRSRQPRRRKICPSLRRMCGEDQAGREPAASTRPALD